MSENTGNKRIFELADQLKALKERKKTLEEETKANNAEIDRVDRELSDAMADAELEKFTRCGSTFYLTSQLFASPKEGQRSCMMQALREHGFGAMVTETVNAKTLASFCKEQIELSGEKQALPEWLSNVVSTFEKISVGVRKK
jgi:hypothetical protein